MSVLEIPAKEASPYVKFDEEKATLLINGKSYDEDIVMLFNMVRSKIQTFGRTKPEKLDVTIYLKYFNTAASKCLYSLLADLKELGQNAKMTLEWNFVEGDEEMEEEINEFKEVLDMDFKVEPIAVDAK